MFISKATEYSADTTGRSEADRIQTFAGEARNMGSQWKSDQLEHWGICAFRFDWKIGNDLIEMYMQVIFYSVFAYFKRIYTNEM